MPPAISTRRLGRISCKSLEPLWGNPFGVPEATHKNLYNLLGIPSDIINPVRTLRPTIVTQARANPSTSLD
jgi:hypothetical protein